MKRRRNNALKWENKESENREIAWREESGKKKTEVSGFDWAPLGAATHFVIY